MTLYLDTSCLLKVFFPEPETVRTIEAIAAEPSVVVSSLARLETAAYLHGRVAARQLSARAARQVLARIDAVLRSEPYELVPCPAAIIEVAETQIGPMLASNYCRTLDRLHLAAMQVLGVRRLLTNDRTQAHAARALGFEVHMPRQ